MKGKIKILLDEDERYTAGVKDDLVPLIVAQKAMDEYAKELSIGFETWRHENDYTKRNYTHPNKVGKYFSNIHCDGYHTLEDLFNKYLQSIK